MFTRPLKHLLERNIEFSKYAVNTETKKPKDFQRFNSNGYLFEKQEVGLNANSDDRKGIISNIHRNENIGLSQEKSNTSHMKTEKLSSTLQRYYLSYLFKDKILCLKALFLLLTDLFGDISFMSYIN